MEIKDIFSSRLRFMRLMRKISQTDFCEKIGVTRVALVYYEAGKRIPNIDVLKHIAQELHVSADFLIGNTEADKTSEMQDILYRIKAEDGKYKTYHLFLPATQQLSGVERLRNLLSDTEITEQFADNLIKYISYPNDSPNENDDDNLNLLLLKLQKSINTLRNNYLNLNNKNNRKILSTTSIDDTINETDNKPTPLSNKDSFQNLIELISSYIINTKEQSSSVNSHSESANNQSSLQNFIRKEQNQSSDIVKDKIISQLKKAEVLKSTEPTQDIATLLTQIIISGIQNAQAGHTSEATAFIDSLAKNPNEQDGQDK